MKRLHQSLLPLEGGINFRDLGGYQAIDRRRIKQGLLFRSGSLHRLTEQDQNYLSQLSVTHILDYRDSHEISSQPDLIWSGACYIHQPANSNKHSPSITLAQINNALLDQFDCQQFIVDLYHTLPFNNPAYSKLVQLLLNNPLVDGKPISLVQHCAVGKDRTGIGVALLLLALGIDRQTVIEDYLLTQSTLASFRQTIEERYAPQLSDENRHRLHYVMSAREEFIVAALDMIIERYGTFERWLAEEYGLDQQQRELLQQRYLQD